MRAAREPTWPLFVAVVFVLSVAGCSSRAASRPSVDDHSLDQIEQQRVGAFSVGDHSLDQIETQRIKAFSK